MLTRMAKKGRVLEPKLNDIVAPRHALAFAKSNSPMGGLMHPNAGSR